MAVEMMTHGWDLTMESCLQDLSIHCFYISIFIHFRKNIFTSLYSIIERWMKRKGKVVLLEVMITFCVDINWHPVTHSATSLSQGSETQQSLFVWDPFGLFVSQLLTRCGARLLGNDSLQGRRENIRGGFRLVWGKKNAMFYGIRGRKGTLHPTTHLVAFIWWSLIFTLITTGIF